MGLRRIVTFGDPAQLNPFGSSDGRSIPSGIDLFYKHHKAESHFLDMQYRLPGPPPT
jgi:hypothetical protein